MHLRNILRPHQNIVTQTQPVILSNAGQKNTAAKLSAPGFWIELLTAWHTDQSLMASPTARLFNRKIFIQDKTLVDPSGSICFQWALVLVNKWNKAFLIHFSLNI